MKSLKEGGIAEVRSLKNRIGRAQGKGRIKHDDANALWESVDALERKILEMDEEED